MPNKPTAQIFTYGKPYHLFMGERPGFNVSELQDTFNFSESNWTSGLDKAVQERVASSDCFQVLCKWLRREIKYCGRLTVFCNDGKYRSVAVAELLANELRAAGYRVVVTHRDINKQEGKAS